jgi:hypothetical protein
MVAQPAAILGKATLALTLALSGSVPPCLAEASPQDRVFLCCEAANDIYRVLQANGVACARFDTPEQALKAAPEGAGVLILADWNALELSEPRQAPTK